MKHINLFRKSSMEPIPPKKFTLSEAQEIATSLKINFTKEKFDLQQFAMGINVELEHGSKYPNTNVTKNDPILTGKIALAHLQEFPDYYTRLKKLEEEATAYWSTRKKNYRK